MITMDVSQEVIAILQELSADPDTEIPPHVPLHLLGFDSLDLLEAMHVLEQRWGVDLGGVEPSGLTAAGLAMEIESRV